MIIHLARKLLLKHWLLMAAVLAFSVWLKPEAGAVPASGTQPPPKKKTLHKARWELQMLGINDKSKLQLIRKTAKKRPVKLAIVGTGGVSKSLLAKLLVNGNTLEYCDGAKDPRTNTHDTQEANIMLQLSLQLGIRMHLLVYQPSNSYSAIGEAFAQAGKAADLVVLFQSFWGKKVPRMAERVRQAKTALFISPYVQVGKRPTNTCLQSYAAKPGGGGIPHFVTCTPMSYRAPGVLIHPLCRDKKDSETINFVAPSYYASGSGGTCPSAAVTTIVAAFIVAISPEKPDPVEILRLMRETVCVDKSLLTSTAEINDEAAKRLQSEIDFLVKPDKTGTRRLDAPGLLNLWNIFIAICGSK